MKDIIDMAADRGMFIDQSQSMNLFVESPNMGKLTSMHFYAWEKGLKTGMYYLRTKAASAAIKFTVKKKVEKIPDDEAFKLEDANVKVAVKEQLETMADDEAFKTEDTAVKVAVEVAKKPAVKSVNIDYTPEEILACSIDNPDDCEACGS